jgi:hypothetical protein
MAKEAVIETAVMIYGDDGILRIRINEGANIDLSQAKLTNETIRRLCGDAKILVLTDATAQYTITKEAQEFGAQHVDNRIATAVLSSNPLGKISLNIFLSIFKPSTKFKFFTNEEKAVEWLKSMR